MVEQLASRAVQSSGSSRVLAISVATSTTLRLVCDEARRKYSSQHSRRHPAALTASEALPVRAADQGCDGCPPVAGSTMVASCASQAYNSPHLRRLARPLTQWAPAGRLSTHRHHFVISDTRVGTSPTAWEPSARRDRRSPELPTACSVGACGDAWLRFRQRGDCGRALPAPTGRYGPRDGLVLGPRRW